jgi:acetoacetate decarboxylase
MAQVAKANNANPEYSTRHTVRSIRAFYETDRAIAACLLPRPLIPGERPEIFVQFAHVTMHLPQQTVTIGAATVGVAASYESTRGYYVLAMPMEGEFVVIGGRETFGEPKKLAKVEFEVGGGRVRAAAERHGIDFLEVRGTLGASTGPSQFEEHLFCYKAMPSIRKGEGFDGDVFLTRLDWKRNYVDVRPVTGEVVLRESAYDPLVDVPVRKLVRMEYCEGTTNTSGVILTKVPGEWLLPFWHGRYDDTSVPGIDVPARTAA